MNSYGYWHKGKAACEQSEEEQVLSQSTSRSVGLCSASYLPQLLPSLSQFDS